MAARTEIMFPLSERGARAQPPEARVRAAVDAHYDLVWRFVRRLGVPAAHVEDVAQEALVVFARRIAEVKPGAERGFLMSTALRVASDARRKAARAPVVPVEELAIEPAHPEGDAEALLAQAERRAWLDVVLDALPEEQRAVLVMCDLEEMTMAETAEVLGVAAGTVASRLRRARATFEVEASALRERLVKEETR